MADLFSTKERDNDGVTLLIVEEGRERTASSDWASLGLFRTLGTSPVLSRRKAGFLSFKERQGNQSGKTSCASSFCTETDDSERRSFLADVSENESILGSPLAKRKRGRPSTTWQYVGLAEAKTRKLNLDCEELRLQAERELLMRRWSNANLALPLPTPDQPIAVLLGLPQPPYNWKTVVSTTCWGSSEVILRSSDELPAGRRTLREHI